MKIRKIHIQDYKIFKDFIIDFTSNGNPLDIIILAGINGSGKSSLLEFIYKLISTDSIPFNENNKIIGEKFDIESGRLIATTFRGAVSKDISVSNQLNESKGEYFVDKGVLFYKTTESDVLSAGKAIINYIDKLIYEKDKKSSEVYEIVKEKLNSIFEGFDLQVEFNLLDKERNIFFKNDKSEPIPIFGLSGGEKELITKAFTLYISDIKNKVILIDEPESSLHPNWQNRILKIYEDFAKENNNQIIIATHSPHIIASAKKESLRLLVKKGDKIEVVSDFDGSYGYEVQTVLTDIMGLDSLRTVEIKKKLQTLKDLVFENNYKSQNFKSLMEELESILGRGDIDLGLLRLEIAKREKMDEKD